MPLSLYRTGTYINRVFKKYNVIDDIAELIDKQVHKDRMKIICWVIEKVIGKSKNLLEKKNPNISSENYDAKEMKIIREKAFFKKTQFIVNMVCCEWHNIKRKTTFENEWDDDLWKQVSSPLNEYPNYMSFGSYEGRGKNRQHISSIKKLIAFDKKYTDFQQTNKFKMNKGFKIKDMVDIFIKNKIPYTTKFNKKMFIEKWFKWVPEDKNDKKDKKK